MQETIGNIIIDHTYASGPDPYRDRAEEKELLEIAKHVRPEDWNQEIARRRNWNVLYHFSHIRQNLAEWLPLKKTDRVLEIGSGCGALTGVLAAKAGQVTCLERSGIRCEINAYRHREYDNIRILHGSYPDALDALENVYDVIVLYEFPDLTSMHPSKEKALTDLYPSKAEALTDLQPSKADTLATLHVGKEEGYEKMIRQLSERLTLGGTLVLAAANRLGLRYWAGYPEEQTGMFFGSLGTAPEHWKPEKQKPEHREPDDRRTEAGRRFSRTELLRLLEQSGEFHATVYYPWPDHRFPMTVYSDAYLPKKGELKENYRNLDRARVQLFEEPGVYDTLIENGLYPEFANAFLILAEKKTEQKSDPENQKVGGAELKTDQVEQKADCSEQIIFTKYSNERSREFAIRTDIIRTNAGLCVKKTALYPEGRTHVESLPEKEQALASLYQEAGWRCNHSEKWNCGLAGKPDCKQIENRNDRQEEESNCRQVEKSGSEQAEAAVRLEFEQGETLEERLDHLLMKEETETAKRLLTDFLENIQTLHEKHPFHRTEAFTQVFGNVPELPHASCADVTNIDLLCQNLICKEQGAHVVLDYEWTFFFPVPCGFLLYRIIHYYLETGELRKKLSAEEFYQRFSITNAQKHIYEQMEASFQRYLIRGITPIRELYSDITPGYCSMREVMSGKLQVFFETDGTYLPEHSRTLALRDWEIDTEIPLPAGCRTIRLDPCEEPCMVQFVHLDFDGQTASLSGAGVPDGGVFAGSAGSKKDAGFWGYFYGKDPAIFFLPVPSGAKQLHIEMKVYPTPADAVRRAMRQEEKIRQQEQQLHAMEDTKVWKLYRRYRDIREKRNV